MTPPVLVPLSGGPSPHRVPASSDGLPVVDQGERFDVFDAGGGVQVAKLYAAPVNVKDVTGKWVKVDTSLVSDAKGRFGPKSSSLPVSFAE